MKASYFKLFSIILISCLGMIIYSNTFHCSFAFDDRTSICDNFAIKNLYDLQSIWNFLPRRFILYLSIALNYHFNGLSVFGYHLFNLAVHLVSAILVWWLVLLTFSTSVMKEGGIEEIKGPRNEQKVALNSKRFPDLKQSQKISVNPHVDLIALLAGLVFVSHPLQTEAVTYIVQRTASMATLFYLATLCFYIKSRFLLDKNPTLILGRIFYICSLFTAIIAMFTKETAITLPLMILLYEFCFLKSKKGFKWGYTLPFLLTIFIIPMTMLLTESPEAQKMRGILPDAPADISSLHYLLTQFRVMVTYLRLIFIPLNQNLDYDYPISHSLFEWPTFLSFLFLISIMLVAKKLFLKYRLVSFSIFWFFLTLLPESSFLPIKDVIFEHRLYLPMVGYSLFLVSGVYYLLGKNAVNAMLILLIMIIAFNSVLTYQRNKVWSNEFTLWNDVIHKSPHKARPYNNRGNLYFQQGNLAKALLDYNKAIELNPRYAEAFNNRGSLYNQEGNFTEALLDYNKAIELNPNYAEVFSNRANLYGREARLTEAFSDCQRAVELNPRDAQAFDTCGVIYAQEGNFTQAISDISNSIELNPKYEKAYTDRCLLYDTQGDFAQAISDCNMAIAINSGYAEAYNNLGLVYDHLSNPILAMANFNKAIELNPKYAEAYLHLGVSCAKENDFFKAMLNFNKAIKNNSRYAEAYVDRGLLYDKQSNFSQALSDYTKAIEINPHLGSAYNNRAISYYHLKEYDKAWGDVHKIEGLGAVVNPDLIKALKQVSIQ